MTILGERMHFFSPSFSKPARFVDLEKEKLFFKNAFSEMEIWSGKFPAKFPSPKSENSGKIFAGKSC